MKPPSNHLNLPFKGYVKIKNKRVESLLPIIGSCRRVNY
jgi:hypothetical protein